MTMKIYTFLSAKIQTIILVITGFFLLQSCINYHKVAGVSDLHYGHLTNIPFGAYFVVVDMENTSAENLYLEIQNRLAQTGHRIEMQNDTYMMLTTRGKMVRENRLEQRMEIRVRNTAFGARAVMETFHRHYFTHTTRSPGVWTGTQWDNLSTNLAFAETVSMALGVHHALISYHSTDPFFFWESRIPIVDFMEF